MTTYGFYLVNTILLGLLHGLFKMLIKTLVGSPMYVLYVLERVANYLKVVGAWLLHNRKVPVRPRAALENFEEFFTSDDDYAINVQNSNEDQQQLESAVLQSFCARCLDECVELHPAQCREDPRVSLARGMYHCPECGTMVLSGFEHPYLCKWCAALDHPLYDHPGVTELNRRAVERWREGDLDLVFWTVNGKLTAGYFNECATTLETKFEPLPGPAKYYEEKVEELRAANKAKQKPHLTSFSGNELS